MLNLFTDYRIGGKPRYYLAEQPEHLMRVPDDIKRCVMFVLYRDSEGQTLLAGTAFLIAVELQDVGVGFGYCVTARHILAKIHLNSVDQVVILRLNRKDGTFGEVETPYHHWQYHPDDSTVDAAVLAWSPSLDHYDVGAVPIENAAIQELIEVENIGIGDEVFVTGLFSNHYGEHRILPIVRTGNLALMSDERVYVKDFGEIEAYLIESRSIGGLSGSPVFVQKFPVRVKDGKIYTPNRDHVFYWLGLIHGHWDVQSTISSSDEIADTVSAAEKVNMGIAIVVPSTKIVEIINQPYFADVREAERKKRKDERAPTADSSDQPVKQADFTEEDFEDALRKVSRRDKSEEDKPKKSK